MVSACYDGIYACPFFSWDKFTLMAAPTFKVTWTPGGSGNLVLIDPASKRQYPMPDYSIKDTTPDPIGECSAGGEGGHVCWRIRNPARVPTPSWCPLRANAVTVRLAETG